MEPEGQAGQASKSLEMRVINNLGETFVVNEHEVLIGFGTPGDHSLAVPL
jgi:hypothetical protein